MDQHTMDYAIISLIPYCICLKLSPNLFFAIPLIGVFISIMGLDYVPFHLLEPEGKWIRRELRLLRALSEDVKGVLKSRAEIDMIASQLWDSEINPEMTELLNPTEADWIARADDLAFPADILLKGFRGCNERRQFDKWYFLRNNHRELLDEMKQIKKEIEAHLKEKSMVDICGTLERSRAHIQSLQDKLESTSFKKQDCAAAALISSILKKENKNRHSVDGMDEKIQLIELRLSFLLAFLRDLEGIDFQSETEKAWVEEASEIIDEAQCAIKTFIQRPERRFLAFTNGMAPRHKHMEYIKDGLSELLNRKERYCLKFTRRDPSKSVTRSPHQKEIQISNPTVVSRVEVKKQYWLDQMKNNLTGEYQVKTLCDQLEEMDRQYEAAEAIEGVNYSRKAWLDQMKKTVTKAEKTIVAYIQTTEEERKKEGTNILNSLFDNTTENFLEYYSTIGFMFPGNSSISERTHAAKLSKENEQMSEVILVLKKSIKAYRTEIREESTSVAGLEEDIHGLISKLTINEKPIVSIVGMRGIGKTTLAKKVYNHGAITNYFNARGWVSLSQKPFGNTLQNEDEKLILGELEKLGEQNGGSWIEKLRHFLEKEKNLLVLDNISSGQVWDTLIDTAFPANGSKIMVTTRDKSLASQAGQSSTQHQLRLRTKEESWKLFTQMVPEIPPESEKIIKAKVLERCEGLPLAIFRLGYHLIGKHVTKENFLMALESIEHYEKPWIEAVVREELPDQLMKCIAYIRKFPSDYEIPARRVVASWVAEELVQQSAEDSPECVAEKCLADLKNWYIIQVLERKLDGKIKTFCLINALREHLSQDESSDQRLADQFHERDDSFKFIHGELKDSSDDLQKYKDLLSYLSFDPREGNKPGEDIGNFFDRGIATGCFRLLKVLDLERVFRPILPKSIGNLSALKYLGLRWTYLEFIPSSIGNLKNLITLDLKHTYIRKLPASIWKLQKLRHLYLNQSYRSKFVRPSGTALKNLQTLSGVFVDEESPLNNGLNRSMNLRKLKLAFHWELSEKGKVVLAEWISRLSLLQSLRLRSIGEMGEPSDLHLETLLDLEKLSSLYLFGRLKKPSIMEKLPQSLTEVTLSASQLLENPMLKLSKLRDLRSLCLYSGSYKGTAMVCYSDDFPQLLVLKLWMLDDLERWDVKEKAMPNLRELEIRSCNKLEIPTGLKHLDSLQELKLTNMPKDFTTIQEKKWEIWGDIDYPPRITIENW
ncbi:probable disease resistance protein RF9 isoform X1 [Quercus robur]|uniref:probable disease resistance protein RF9 isoform X1 n=1 Tax=Quercus robur TaxID=38942 RepID=UPI00216305A6|nr:probable disease resistance protein RF9 isoform X1 [Quercus robur]